MEFLADTWVLWFVLTMICMGLVFLNRQNRRIETGFITSADEFSIKTVLFGLRRGEGDLFMGYILAICFFSLFVVGFVRWIRTVF